MAKRALIELTGHPDSFTTKDGPLYVDYESIESVSTWQGGSRIVMATGTIHYVEESVTVVVEEKMMEASKWTG